MILSNQAQSSATQNLTSREDESKIKMLVWTFNFNLPKSQTKRIKPKYFASIIKLKDLKSMIFEHQNHILSLRFWSHSNPRNKKPHMKRKKEKKKWFWSLKMKQIRRKSSHLGVCRSSLNSQEHWHRLPWIALEIIIEGMQNFFGFFYMLTCSTGNW